jgi:endo-1,4-beta-D-glucanase Y
MLKIGEHKKLILKIQDTRYIIEINFKVISNAGFKYGNQTAVLVNQDQTFENIFDTRYFIGSLDDFIKQWKKDYYPNYTILNDNR